MPAVAAYRWPLACICLPICAICMWGAAVLPWRSWTTFALFTAGVGGCHGVTGILALLGRPQRMAAWRLQSAVSLGFVAWITWNTWNSATYIAALYGGLGSGVAVALGLAWLLVALLFTPMAIWGLVTTGIRLRARRTAAAALLVPLLLVAGAWRNQAAAQGLELESAKADESELMNLVQRSVSATGSRNPPANPPRSLMTSQPATCPGRLPDAGVTAFVTYVAGAESGTEVRHECVQSTSLETLKGDLTAALAQRVGTSPVVVDVVTVTVVTVVVV